MLKELLAWYQASLDSGGYPLIALLMAIESSIVPLPSEFIIPPAAMLVASSGRFSYAGIIVAGALGSWFGATVMYWASRWAGRPLVMRFAEWQVRHPIVLRFATSKNAFARLVTFVVEHLMITPAKVEKAERWFAGFGSYGVFVSRLLPVIRHLIGIPAGIVRLNYATYSIFTLVGSAAWCSVLVWVGVKAGSDQALMEGQLHQILLWLLGALAALGAIYYLFVHRFTKSR